MISVEVAGYNVVVTAAILRLQYDGLASGFEIEALYDPNDEVHRTVFRPLGYQRVRIKWNNTLVLTGEVVSVSFRQHEGGVRDYATIRGASLPGILDSVTPHPDSYPLQINNKPRLEDLVRQLVAPYGLQVVIDEEVAERCRQQVGDNLQSDGTVMVGDILARACNQLNVVLSHDAYGRVVLTKVKADKLTKPPTAKRVVVATAIKRNDNTNTSLLNSLGDNTLYPDFTDYSNQSVLVTSEPTDRGSIYTFSSGSNWYNVRVNVDGQDMHRTIQVRSQADAESKSPGYADKMNSLVPASSRRHLRVVTDTGSKGTVAISARAVLGQELLGIGVEVDMRGWLLNGQLVRPNRMVTIDNRSVYIKRSRWFVRRVELTANPASVRAVLTCVLPECFNDEDVKSVF